MVSEISVMIKDDEKRMTKKYLIYENYQACEDDPIIQQCIKETLDNFDGDPEDITVNIKIEVQ